jgi:hypothetical protein
MKLSNEILKRLIEEEMCQQKKQNYDARRYKTEGLNEDDFQDDGSGWIKIRRSAFESMMKRLHPVPIESDGSD